MEIEVFRAGQHTDSAGNSRLWTEVDLDTIVEKYNPAEHEAPVVIGHPENNAPAWGWVESLRRSGDTLFARLKSLVPEFVDLVKKGMYRKRSISLYPDLTLRHIGFLGAVPPAVKGLADVKFEGGAESIVVEFTETENKREIPVNGGGRMEEKVLELQQRIAAQEAELLQFTEKHKIVTAENEQLKKALADEKARQQKAEAMAFCDRLVAEGRLTPAMVPTAAMILELTQGAGEYEFTEGQKVRPVEKIKELLSALPVQVELGELAKKSERKSAKFNFSGSIDPERLDMHQKAMVLAEEENLSYKTALTKIMGMEE